VIVAIAGNGKKKRTAKQGLTIKQGFFGCSLSPFLYSNLKCRRGSFDADEETSLNTDYFSLPTSMFFSMMTTTT
jgi:hypothetical protein